MLLELTGKIQSRTSGAEARSDEKALTDAVNRCATQHLTFTEAISQCSTQSLTSSRASFVNCLVMAPTALPERSQVEQTWS